MAKGKFISFEGGEGVGKTTQIKRLTKYLKDNGIDFITTREPGGTPASEEIRRLFLSKNSKDFAQSTDLLLNFASRSEHIDKVIKPSLEAGKWVICDRFIDSTIVYQGYIGGIDIDQIKQMHALAFGDFYPDLTLVLDLDVDTAMRRTLARGENNRFDNQDRDFYLKINAAYRDLAKENEDRCKLIDVSTSMENVTQQIVAFIEDL